MKTKAFIKLLALVLIFFTTKVLTASDISRNILGKIKRPGGVCVILEPKNILEAKELALKGNYLVKILLHSKADLKTINKDIRLSKMIGKISAALWSSKRLPFGDNMVNLIISQSRADSLDAKDIARTLCPNGYGVFRSNGKIKQPALKGAGFKNIAPIEVNCFMAINAPKKGLGEWTHWRHGADGNPFSEDKKAGPPNQLRWQAGPGYARFKTGGMLLTKDGVNYYLADIGESSQHKGDYVLMARDSYNGKLLWMKDFPLKQKTAGLNLYKNKFVLGGNYIFLPDPITGHLGIRDAKTGTQLKVLKKASPPEKVLYSDGYVYLSNSKTGITAFEVKSGQLKWSVKDSFKYTKHAWMKFSKNIDMLIGDDNLYYLNGKAEVIGLNKKTGKEAFRVFVKKKMDGSSLFLNLFTNNMLFLGEKNHRSWKLGGDNGRVIALSVLDKKTAWTYDYLVSGHGGSVMNMIYFNKSIWVHEGLYMAKFSKLRSWVQLDIKTGQPLNKMSYAPKGPATQRCYPDRASANFIIGGSFDFWDHKKKIKILNRVAKGTCEAGFWPSNGLIYSMPRSCVCYPMLTGYVAFAHTPLTNKITQLKPVFAKGKASVGNTKNTPSDWSQFRSHPNLNAAGLTDTPVGSVEIWKKEYAGKLTPPVVANATILFASVDANELYALNSDTGKELWRYPTNGRLNGPPSIAGDACIFGSQKGYLTCLNLITGKLVWKMKMFSDTEWIIVDEKFEAAFPVVGSVMVENGIAYVVAGRHSQLIKGVWVLAVEIKTGKIIWQSRSNPAKPRLADLIVKAGDKLALGQEWFDLKTGKRTSRPVVRYLMAGVNGAQLILGNSWNFRMQQRIYYLAGERLVFTKDKHAYGTKYTNKSYTFKGFEIFGMTDHSKKKSEIWRRKSDIRISALITGSNHLYACGAIMPPNFFSKKSTVVIDDKKAQLNVINTKTGVIIEKVKLMGAPVRNGLALYKNKIYYTTTTGFIACVGKK